MSVWARISNRYLDTGAAGSAERRVELLAMVLGVLLLLQLVLGGIGLLTLSEPDAVRPSLGGVDDARLDSRQEVTEAQRLAISERPLFWTSRRPEAPAGGSNEASTASRGGGLKGVQVLGVFGSGGTAGAIALVDDRQQRVLLGETLQGWELEAVHPDRVELARGGRHETLYLQQRGGDGAGAAGPARSTPAPAARGRRAAMADRGKPEPAQTRPVQTGNKDKSGDPAARKLGWGGE